MKNKQYIFIVISVVLALAGFWWLKASGQNPSDASAGPGPASGGMAIPVRVLQLAAQPFAREYRFNGTLEARERVVIRSELAGRVAKIHFDDGERVQHGAVLIELDAREWAAELDAAREELELARLNAERLRQLFANNAITQRERDEALSRQAVLAAQVVRLSTRLERATIVAPFDGVLGFRQISLGALVEPSAQITSLTSTDPIIVDFIVPEALREAIAIDAEIGVSIAGEAEQRLAAIRLWEPTIDPITRTVRVRAYLDNADGQLLPGAFARVTLQSTNEAAIVIPAEALIRGLADVAVFVVEEGQAQRRVVRVGSRDGESVEILAGLEAGDRLIFRGMQRARSGGPVEITEERKQSIAGR